MEEVFKVDEVADILKVSKATVQRWCAAGKLPAFKIGQHWRISGAMLRQVIADAAASPADEDPAAGKAAPAL